MSSAKRPYLLRAYYDWFLDNDLTPYLVVNALYPNTKVPQDFVRDGQIVLNIAPSACGNLLLGNERIQFSARFRGVPQEIVVPLGAAMAIYARENGDGVLFEDEDAYQLEPEITTDQPNDFSEAVDPPKKPKRKDAGHLKIIK
ncbi:ClpXP protease specificity-enhancing factor [Pasteurellaceae bacterium TAE3-ERU1]|uniref:ClpXP protease specificity-enhancing factor n=1 Tax=Spirabiliibacterium mucosae TaxID=28156 RepID=UPI001AAD7F29|nr:ClpXP protease specificity-enhancing factor [Spirabiliibacterium mucosae]MBE2897499.1 ClpXP protease specificity-enhancing factor [Spirabiliibacterium mucosae]MBV7387862.1 ClpXP protease specificity-enhancing factor [Pasteurellaceae bacterium TAE3-ERU1]